MVQLETCSSQRGHVAVAGGIDADVAQNGLAPGFAFDHNPIDGAPLAERADTP